MCNAFVRSVVVWLCLYPYMEVHMNIFVVEFEDVRVGVYSFKEFMGGYV